MSGRWLEKWVVGVSFALAMAGSGWAAGGNREQQNAMTQSGSFLAGHPDMRWRTEGVKSYGDGRYMDALKQFKRAARHADKPAQAMIADMYWRGEGVKTDRALAYAWMDLAAERGYKFMLAKREAYWMALTEAERSEALQRGVAVYAEFGDEAAKPRIEKALHKARAQTTGSRVGAVGALTVLISDGAGGFMSVDGSQYYNTKFWKPDEYFKWQEQVWSEMPRGQVEVGELQPEASADSVK